MAQGAVVQVALAQVVAVRAAVWAAVVGLVVVGVAMVEGAARAYRHQPHSQGLSSPSWGFLRPEIHPSRA